MIPIYDYESLGLTSYINQGVIITPFFDESICQEIAYKTKNAWDMAKFDRLPCWGGGSDNDPRTIKHLKGISPASNDIWLESIGEEYIDLFYRTCKETAEKEIKKYYPLFFKSQFYSENDNGHKWCKPWIMRYSTTHNRDMEVHLDFSTFTISVALNDDFQGGELYFPNHGGFKPFVPIGHAVIFPGLITHPHGVHPIRNGVRFSLISMMYGQDLRAITVDGFKDHYQPYTASMGGE